MFGNSKHVLILLLKTSIKSNPIWTNLHRNILITIYKIWWGLFKINSTLALYNFQNTVFVVTVVLLYDHKQAMVLRQLFDNIFY